MIIELRSRPDMAAAHRRKAPRLSASEVRPSARAHNIEPVLSIGQTEFIHFRGRAFGVPPLPWQAGAALTEAHVDAMEAMEVLARDAKDRDALSKYYGAIRKMPGLLWANCYPVGRIAGFVKSIPLLRRLLRNPFARASDGELLEYSDFFLARRMRSGGRRPLAAANPARRTS